MMTRVAGRSGVDRRWVVGAVALPIAFVVALVVALGGRSTPVLFPPSAAADPASPAASPVARTTNVALAPATGTPPPVPERENALAGACWRIEVRDASGATVPGVTVTVFDGDTVLVNGATDAAGVLQLPNAIDPLAGASWKIAAVVPALVTLQPVFPLTHDATTVVTIGELGWLEVAVLGARDTTTLSLIGDAMEFPESGMSVEDWKNVENVGGRSVLRGFQRGFSLRVPSDPFDVPWPGSGNDVAPYRVTGTVESWRIPAPPMAMQWALAASLGPWRANTFVAGPTRVGDVVPVVLDIRRCTLHGRVDDHARSTVTNGEWQQECGSDEFPVRPDGTFAIDVRRNAAAFVTLANEHAHVGWTVPAIDADAFDLGTIVVAPRPLLGTVEVRDDRGERVHVLPSRAAAIEVGSPAQPPWRRSIHAPVTVRQGSAGIEVLGADGVAAAALCFTQRGFFFGSEDVRVANGATVRVDCVRAARLVVHVDGAQDLVRLQLRDDVRQETTRATDVGTDAAGQHHDFRNVRPGRHRIVGAGVAPDTFVDLRSGEDREVRVTAR